MPDAENVILALQDVIRRTDESRYDHRLHGLLLVAQGMTAPQVGRLLGDSTRSVQYWVRQFEEEGLAGLAEGAHPGRPRRLTEAQLKAVEVKLAYLIVEDGVGVVRKLTRTDGTVVHLAQVFSLAEKGQFPGVDASI